MLRKIRIALAVLCFAGITLLFLDFTGSVHAYLGWLARIQLLPALLAVNVAVVIGLIVITLLFGRIYCSVICPLGVMQDLISHFAGRFHKNRFSHSPAKNWLRYCVLVLFVAALVGGIGSLAALLAPYSAFGRIASNLLAPVWQAGNNVLAYFAERIDSYAFYATPIWIKSISTFVVAVVTLLVVGFLAWRNGRTYCNTICPVGSLLGLISRHSLYRLRIDTDLCNGCKLCTRNCKAACIDGDAHQIDMSRCVVCGDCIGKCHKNAISYSLPHKKATKTEASASVDSSRRKFLGLLGLFAYTAVRAQEKKVDGGLALIEEKKIPKRATPITPPGSMSLRNMAQHCTGCQLCVSVCPNEVLRPSSGLMTMMQPLMSYERGYCRPECTRCSEVCPAGAIRPITREEKSATQIGHAVWIEANCVAVRDGVSCTNCARHCPVGAIKLVRLHPDDPNSPHVPTINEERCIGCGACENLCPARPFSAIYVEGHAVHRTI